MRYISRAGRRLYLKIAALTVFGLVIGGCSGGQVFQPEAAAPTAVVPSDAAPVAPISPSPNPAPEPERPPAPEPEPEIEFDPDVIYIQRDLLNNTIPSGGNNASRAVRSTDLWKGGMVGGTFGLQSGTSTIWGWLPGMVEPRVCDLSILAENERPTNDNLDIAATTGNTPRTAIAYSATTLASGLTPEQTRLFIQPLNLYNCELGERIDILGRAWDGGSTRPGFVGASDDVLAVSLNGGRQTRESSDFPIAIGYNLSTNQQAWTINGTASNLDVVIENLGLQPFALIVRGSRPINRQDFISITDGSSIYECITDNASQFGWPYALLGNGELLFQAGSNQRLASNCSRASNPTDSFFDARRPVVIRDGGLDIIGNMLDSQSSSICLDSAANPIIVGMLTPHYSRDGGLYFIDSQAQMHQLIGEDLVSSLNIRYLGCSDGVIYIRTSAETLTIGLDGEQIGSAVDTQLYPYIPRGERYLDGHLWTIWAPGSGNSISATQEGGAISRDGVVPVAFTMRDQVPQPNPSTPTTNNAATNNSPAAPQVGAVEVLGQFLRPSNAINAQYGLSGSRQETEPSWADCPGCAWVGRTIGQTGAWCWFPADVPLEQARCERITGTTQQVFDFVTEPIEPEDFVRTLNERVGSAVLTNSRWGYSEILVNQPDWETPAWLLIEGNEQTFMMEPSSEITINLVNQ